MLRSVTSENEKEIARIAGELVIQYGREAETVAAAHAESMLELGDLSALDRWEAVMEAICKLHIAKTI